MFLRTYQPISTICHRHLLESGDTKGQAIYAYYKTVFVNSVISNYKDRNITKRKKNIGYCRSTFVKHIQYLISSGYAVESGSIVRLISKQELADKHKKKHKKAAYYPYKMKRGTIKDILLQLQVYPIINKFKQINFDPIQRGNKISLTSAIPVAISSNWLSKELGVSKSTAQRVMRRSNYRYTIKWNHQRRWLAPYLCEEQFEALKRTEIGVFHWKGSIWQKKPSVFLPMELYKYGKRYRKNLLKAVQG